MITKDEFVKSLNKLKEQSDIDHQFNYHMEQAFPGSYAPIYHNVLWELSVHLLELSVKDEEKTFHGGYLRQTSAREIL